MKINIQSIHFTPGEELNDYITGKVSSLSRLHPRIEAGNVALRLDRSAKKGNKVCEIRLVIPGNDLFASGQCPTFEEAASRAVEALQSQLRKRKTVLSRKRS